MKSEVAILILQDLKSGFADSITEIRDEIIGIKDANFMEQDANLTGFSCIGGN